MENICLIFLHDQKITILHLVEDRLSDLLTRHLMDWHHPVTSLPFRENMDPNPLLLNTDRKRLAAANMVRNR